MLISWEMLELTAKKRVHQQLNSAAPQRKKWLKRCYTFWTQLPVQKAHLIIRFLSLHQPPYLLPRKILGDFIPIPDMKTSPSTAATTARENLLPFNVSHWDMLQARACYPGVILIGSGDSYNAVISLST